MFMGGGGGTQQTTEEPIVEEVRIIKQIVVFHGVLRGYSAPGSIRHHINRVRTCGSIVLKNKPSDQGIEKEQS